MVVEAEEPQTRASFVATRGFFKMVSLDAQHRPQIVPPVRLTTEEEYVRFVAGHQRHERARKARAAKAEAVKNKMNVIADKK